MWQALSSSRLQKEGGKKEASNILNIVLLIIYHYNILKPNIFKHCFTYIRIYSEIENIFQFQKLHNNSSQYVHCNSYNLCGQFICISFYFVACAFEYKFIYMNYKWIIWIIKWIMIMIYCCYDDILWIIKWIKWIIWIIWIINFLFNTRYIACFFLFPNMRLEETIRRCGWFFG